MATKADVTYRGTPFVGAVFEIGDIHIVVPADGSDAALSFQCKVWPSQASYDAGAEPVPLPEWDANKVTWNPAGDSPQAQAYAYVAAKLQAAGATNITEV